MVSAVGEQHRTQRKTLTSSLCVAHLSINGVPLNWIFPSVIKQYFSPYASADMTKMAQAFNTTVTDLEDELSNLILEGQIQARIDSHNKVREIRLEVWRLTFGGGGKNCELCAQWHFCCSKWWYNFLPSVW